MSSEDDLGDVFKILIVNNYNHNNYEGKQFSNRTSAYFFTSVESLLSKPAVAITEQLIRDLINKACVHQLIAEVLSSIESDEETVDSFTSRSMLKYSSDYFYSIVIDTEAFKYSTAGLDQFQAL